MGALDQVGFSLKGGLFSGLSTFVFVQGDDVQVPGSSLGAVGEVDVVVGGGLLLATGGGLGRAWLNSRGGVLRGDSGCGSDASGGIDYSWKNSVCHQPHPMTKTHLTSGQTPLTIAVIKGEGLAIFRGRFSKNWAGLPRGRGGRSSPGGGGMCSSGLNAPCFREGFL